MFYYQRQIVLIRDEHKCQLCRKDAHTFKIQGRVHHIDGDVKNNKLTNLVLLCFSCHGKVHAQDDFVAFGKKNFKNLEFKIKTHEGIEPPKKKFLFRGI